LSYQLITLLANQGFNPAKAPGCFLDFLASGRTNMAVPTANTEMAIEVSNVHNIAYSSFVLYYLDFSLAFEFMLISLYQHGNIMAFYCLWQVTCGALFTYRSYWLKFTFLLDKSNL
jgi:hypothetical protein